MPVKELVPFTVLGIPAITLACCAFILCCCSKAWSYGGGESLLAVDGEDEENNDPSEIAGSPDDCFT